MLDLFNLFPDHALDLAADASFDALYAQLSAKLEAVLDVECPDRLLVHGGGVAALAAAHAARRRNIPIAHVEAGLRSSGLVRPGQPEGSRRAIDGISDLLFAPTEAAARNLRNEGLAGRIAVTGNTVVDMLSMTEERIRRSRELSDDLDRRFPVLSSGRKILVATVHRGEHTGSALAGICTALADLARRPGVAVIFPLHPDPALQAAVRAQLSNLENLYLLGSLGYLHFVRLMQRAHAVLTDSGGVQEEAATLGLPLLVIGDATDRIEGLSAADAQLVGTDPVRIVAAVSAVLERTTRKAAPGARSNLYGDGYAAQRIVAALMGER